METKESNWRRLNLNENEVTGAQSLAVSRTTRNSQLALIRARLPRVANTRDSQRPGPAAGINSRSRDETAKKALDTDWGEPLAARKSISAAN